MEFGPRALGARSILADPRDPDMTNKVNNAVKFREWWRPYPAVDQKGSGGRMLESATDSPFMILTAQVKPEKRSVIPAVTHVDGSARPQTVEKEINPLYWRLIDEFGKHTGVPVVMNTSFNLRGEAIVHTPTDAQRERTWLWDGCAGDWQLFGAERHDECFQRTLGTGVFERQLRHCVGCAVFPCWARGLDGSAERLICKIRGFGVLQMQEGPAAGCGCE